MKDDKYQFQRRKLNKYFEYQEQRRNFALKLFLPEKELTEEVEDARNEELEKIDAMFSYAKNQVQEHEITGPLYDNWKMFLPTSLGNILLASELYPYEKYGMNGSLFFPRMSTLFSPEFVAALEEKANQMIFFLNSSMLTYFIGFSALLLGEIGYLDVSRWPSPFLNFHKLYLAPGFSQTSAQSYVFIGIFFVLLGYGIYRSSLGIVKEYTLLIRSSFDLYRHKLLKELELPIPTSLQEERSMWSSLNDFFVAGDRFGEHNIDYQLSPELAAAQNKNKKRKRR